MIRRLRKHVYRAGYRPRYGSIWFSPSLDMLYRMRDLSLAVQDAVDRQKHPRDEPCADLTDRDEMRGRGDR